MGAPEAALEVGCAPGRARYGGAVADRGRRGSGNTRYSGGLAARAAGNIML